MLYPSSLDATPDQLLQAAIVATGLADFRGLPLCDDVIRRLTDEYCKQLPSRLFGKPPSELRYEAKEQAKFCGKIFDLFGAKAMLQIAEREFGASVPGQTEDAKFWRALDARFWSRYYCRQAKQLHEQAYLRAGYIGANRESYVSDASLTYYREYREGQRQWMQNTSIVSKQPSEDGKFSVVSLAEVAKTDDAKRAKLWAFLAGIEQLSRESGLDCAMVTLTLEPKFHPNPSCGNNTWDQTAPRAAAKELSRRWQAIQRDLDNYGIALSGARFVEVHRDGCPHWHVWLHYAPQHLIKILAVVGRYFPLGTRVCRVMPAPRGELRNKRTSKRFTREYAALDPCKGVLNPVGKKMAAQVDVSIINREYGNGATYAAKYACKTIVPGETAERVAAARWLWGFRGFQLFGVRRCLTLWDELYRATPPAEGTVARMLHDAVRYAPGEHCEERRCPNTGETTTVRIEGGTAPFLRLLGGLAAASCLSEHMPRISIGLEYQPGEGRYGELVKVKVGIVIEVESVCWHARTREPGRYALVQNRRVEEFIRTRSLGTTEQPS